MAKNSITDYSKTASLNTDIQSVDIDEGCLPSGINNAIREIMADLAAVNDGTVSLTSPSFAAATITGDLTVDTNTLYVDSTNNRVGIGTSSPTSFDAAGDNLVVGTGSGNNGMTVYSGASNAGSLFFADGTSTAAEKADGYIQFTHSNQTLAFATAATERMRIDSSGNLLVGTTDNLPVANNDASGIALRADGNAQFSRSGAATARFNRGTSDGEIISFHKDGAAVGSINNDGANRLIVNSENTTGYLAVDGAAKFRWRANDFIPHDDNTKDLGHTATRWKDLYLGGGLRADTLTFNSLAGSERMRIDSSGNVGINQSALGGGAKLEVNGDIGIARTAGGYTFRETYGGAERAGINSNASNELLFNTGAATERMRIDSSGNVGIGTNSPSFKLDVAGNARASYFALRSNETVPAEASFIYRPSTGVMGFGTSSAERMRITSSGDVLVGKTSADNGVTAGIELSGSIDKVSLARDGGAVLSVKRLTSDGTIIEFKKDGTTIGSIGSVSGVVSYIVLDPRPTGVGIGGTNLANIIPTNGSGAASDNNKDLGLIAVRWDDIYATNGTIQTSDRNEKENIASMSDAEITAAKAIGKLFKTFKWKDAVAEKGDSARTHAGVIAQDVQQAMTDAGLDAGDYAFFISATWWETQTEVPAVEAVEAQDAVYDEDGNLVTEAVEAVEAQEAYTRTDTYETAEEAPEGATERTRLGIRYPELLAFVGAATEQRLADIETRIATLEGN